MPRTKNTNKKKYVVNTLVNSNYFVFLNEFSKNENLVFVARVIKADREEIRVKYLPQLTERVQRAM
jgi:hypothetical protein